MPLNKSIYREIEIDSFLYKFIYNFLQKIVTNSQNRSFVINKRLFIYFQRKTLTSGQMLMIKEFKIMR